MRTHQLSERLSGEGSERRVARGSTLTRRGMFSRSSQEETARDASRLATRTRASSSTDGNHRTRSLHQRKGGEDTGSHQRGHAA